MATYYGMASNDTIYVRVGANGAIQTNDDPDAFDNVWVNQDSGTNFDLWDVIWNSRDYFYVVGDNGLILRSPDGFSWSVAPQSDVTNENLYAIDSLAYAYMAVGANGTVLVSTDDGASWQILNLDTTKDLRDVDLYKGEYTIVGEDNYIKTGTISTENMEVLIEEDVNLIDQAAVGQVLGNSFSEDVSTDDATAHNDQLANWGVISEGVLFFDSRTSGGDYGDTTSEDFTLADRLLDMPEKIAESFALSDIVESIRGVVKSVAESLEFTDSLSAVAALLVKESIEINGEISENTIQGLSPSENISIKDVLVFGAGFLISENFTASDTVSDIYRAISILKEDLLAIGVVSSNQIAGLVAAASFSLADVTYYGWGATLSENYTLSDIVSSAFIGVITLAEDIELTDSIVENRLVFQVSEESVNMSSIETINQVLYNTFDETINLAVYYKNKDAVYKGWVMNLNNKAMTNYDNYDFNSVARTSGNKYIGATIDGLYELSGEKDDGSFIQSVIRTSTLDFNTSNLKNVAGAYLGYDANGEVIFKVIDDDDTETYYKLDVTGKDLNTNYIKFGKGLLSRYWQFELITVDSTKLELDTLELYPIIAGRKR
jgi:hypothetical protein